ncbi:MAG: HAD-IA family hydrolase [Candidatus Rokubacteria bacterium]|nr:HAD-IA family hydrolase [Candidatus Rokubacteria bacterium]
MTIALVTFDFWQTLLAETPASGAAARALRLSGVREALGRAGRRYDAAALAAADARALAALDGIWRARRDVGPAEQVRVFLEALDPALPGVLSPEERAAVETAYAVPVLAHPPAVAPGAVAAIRWLGTRGLTLGVISNTGRTPGSILRRLLDRAGVLDAFRVFSFSDEIGVRKPDPEIFRRTLAAAGCDPEAAVHVGDDPVNDVAGARALGMRALHYVPDGGPASATADGVLRHFAEVPALLTRLP